MCEFFHVKSVKTFLAFKSKNAALYPDQSLKVRNRLDPDPQLLQPLSFKRKRPFILSWTVDCVRSDQHRLHEPAHEGAGGSHHQPQEALQARPQPSHQQVSQKTIFII